MTQPESRIDQIDSQRRQCHLQSGDRQVVQAGRGRQVRWPDSAKVKSKCKNGESKSLISIRRFPAGFADLNLDSSFLIIIESPFRLDSSFF